LFTFRAFSEDNPGANDYISGSTNNNYFEYYYPSFANSVYGGIAGAGRSIVDNSNGTSTGFTVGVGVTDLNASANAVYYTQIRDLGQLITGRLVSSVNVIQSVTSTYNDFKENVLVGVSDALQSPGFFQDSALTTFLDIATYDTDNKTLTSGGPSGNVYAIWNYGQFVNDVSNANSYALILSVTNSSLGIIQFSNTYFANGVSTGSNILANLSGSATSYALVNLTQYNDRLTSTFEGPSNSISYNVDLRYSTASNVYYSGNNQVNTNAFVGFATNDGYAPLTESDITFRHFQLRVSIVNSKPGQVSTILDKLRYAVNLTRKVFSTSNTINSSNTTIDYNAAGFTVVPTITVSQTSGTDPVVPIITGKTNNQCGISLYYSSNGVSVTGITVDIKADGA
jgi:hypothetical protein